MKTIFLLLPTLVFIGLSGMGQLSKIDTDRPDQTESAALVPKHCMQFEAGFNMQQNDLTENEYLLPTLLTKYGFSNAVELRLITTVIRSPYTTMYGETYYTGIAPVELGTKIALLDENKWIPKTSLLFHVAFPGIASKRLKADKLAPNFRFSMQHTLSGWLGLGYNLGAEWDGFNDSPGWVYTISPGFTIREKWYAYIEAFGIVTTGEEAQHNIDGGLAYYINDNIKTDISSGFGISKLSPAWYVALGFSIRFRISH